MLLPSGTPYQSPFFSVAERRSSPLPQNGELIRDADALREGILSCFSYHRRKIGNPPQWFRNPFTGQGVRNPRVHWTEISDFAAAAGDIKCVWEASRCEWTIRLAQAYCLSGEQDYINTLNAWLSDWTTQNPLNIGPNWKCGQETAIRMLHVLLAAYLLKQHRRPTDALRRFVFEHCSRIAPTLRYALAQDNNHGTSEVAALYIGGSWLMSCSPDEPVIRKKAFKWQRMGRRWLENRVRRLIATDGSFSQYSLNYHRVVLDTLNLVEFWRREWQLPKFSDLFYERSRSALLWLYQTIDPATGDGPNLGANDGARLFVLSETEYRDYRPSVQLASALFFGEKIYPAGKWDEALVCLGLNEKHIRLLSQEAGLLSARDDALRRSRVVSTPRVEWTQSVGTSKPFQGEGCLFPDPKNITEKDGEDVRSDFSLKLSRKSCIMQDGGYVLMHFGTSWAMVRCPNFRFRPAHADALHFDLWCKGCNILRDSGSYSYNTAEPWQSYFAGTQAHNTIEFDGRDQMPRIGRFLFGSWLKMESVGELLHQDGWLSWTGSYRDYRGCRHQRTVHSDGLTWKIIDDIAGFKTNAILRWRLMPGTWQLEKTICLCDSAELSIDASVPIVRCELVEGWESRYYMEKTALPVLELEVGSEHAILTTEIHLKG